MNREQKINRVLAGLSHTGYTTEIEKCEARLLIEDLEKENEKLNHYKLLYQKVKNRNDKAIEYVDKFPLIHYSSVEKIDNKRLSGKLVPVDELLEILKGENNE